MRSTFKHPLSEHTEVSSGWASGIWCLIFGAFYFAHKDNWKHFWMYMLFALMTGGISILIYPFFARSINDKSYLRRGWSRV